MSEGVKVTIGSIVHLKSGSPRMTVVKVNNSWLTTAWCVFGTGQMQYCKLPIEAFMVQKYQAVRGVV